MSGCQNCVHNDGHDRRATERATDQGASFTTPRESDATDARRLVSFAEHVRTGSESRTSPAQPWSKMQSCFTSETVYLGIDFDGNDEFDREVSR